MTRRFGEIEKAEYELKQVESSYLRQRGWKNTCSSPGALWLWEKEVNGKTFVVTTAVAIHVARAMEILHT